MASNGKELLGERYDRAHLSYEEIELAPARAGEAPGPGDCAAVQRVGLGAGRLELVRI